MQVLGTRLLTRVRIFSRTSGVFSPHLSCNTVHHDTLLQVVKVKIAVPVIKLGITTVLIAKLTTIDCIFILKYFKKFKNYFIRNCIIYNE